MKKTISRSKKEKIRGQERINYKKLKTTTTNQAINKLKRENYS